MDLLERDSAMMAFYRNRAKVLYQRLYQIDPTYSYAWDRNTQTYTVGPYTFTLNIPQDFREQVDIRADERFLHVDEKISAAAGVGGNLFTISYSANQDYKDMPNYHVLYQGAQGDLIASFPSDVQFTMEAMEIYHDLYRRNDSILNTFTIID